MAIKNAIIYSISGSGPTPSTSGGSIFTGATIPLTYKDNTTVYENEYYYISQTHDITITGLAGRATITGNGTKSVTVAFDVTSASSSLKNFTITCVKGAETLVYNGMHAHYGTAVTGILTFAFKNITKDGSEGVVGTNYLFIETTSTTLPLFATTTTLWNTIYSYQVLNVLIAKYSSTTIDTNFIAYTYSFNQPITIPSGVTTINTLFMYDCRAFNQPITIPSTVTSIGTYFMQNCFAFNQPFTIPTSLTSISNNFMTSCIVFNHPISIPSSVTTIGASFMSSCQSFNQPITIPSGVTSIGASFMSTCYSFNQPITIPSTVTSIGTSFMYNCFSLSVINYASLVSPTDTSSLSQNQNSKTSASGAGIVVYGSRRTNLMTALPNRTVTPFRKLINGGS